jgi:hypothetical protein
MGRAGRLRLCRSKADGHATARPVGHASDCPVTLRNYSADAGAGSHIITNFTEIPGWRGALLGTVAAGSLWLYSARSARAGPDACDVSVAGVATCQGDQSDGIDGAGAVPPNFDQAITTTLNVNNLTTDITPATGVDGIYFYRDGIGENIVINSDTTDGPNGAKQIIVDGLYADGIFAYSYLGTVDINHTGDIRSNGGRGIAGLARGPGGVGTVDIIARGDIFANRDGIFANALLAVSVDSIGDITSTGFDGIGASSLQSTVNVIDVGTIKAAGDGIFTAAATGVMVNSSGDIISHYGSGIYTRTSAGIADVTSDGDINAVQYGIYARSGSAFSGDDVTITSTGDIRSGRTGILGQTFGGGVTIDHTGDIVANAGHGINAVSLDLFGGAPVMVTSQGSIQARDSGIAAVAFGNITIEHTGDITSRTGVGIAAVSTSGGIDVTLNSGTVAAPLFGVQFLGAGNHTLVNYGTITSPGTAIQSAGGSFVMGNFGTIRGLTQFTFGNNTINNLGTMAADGLVIRGSEQMGPSGDDVVFNDGVITGAVDLRTGNNAFNNLESGVFNSGDYVILGAGRLLSNAGVLSPGGAANVRTTALTGDFTQAPTVLRRRHRRRRRSAELDQHRQSHGPSAAHSARARHHHAMDDRQCRFDGGRQRDQRARHAQGRLRAALSQPE